MAHRWLREWLGFPNWSSLISTSSRCRQGVTGRIPIAWTRPSALVAERGHVLAAGARPRHDCCARPAGLGRGDSAPAPAALVPAAHGLGFPSWARPPCANTARRRVARSPVGLDACPPRCRTRALPRLPSRGMDARRAATAAWLAAPWRRTGCPTSARGALDCSVHELGRAAPSARCGHWRGGPAPTTAARAGVPPLRGGPRPWRLGRAGP